MINIVFEGSPGAGKTTIIKEVVKRMQQLGIKVENTIDIDSTTPLYPIIHSMNENTPLVTSDKTFSTVLYETFIQISDFFYTKERILNHNNEINIFDRFYFSIYAYQKVLIEKEYGKNSKHLLESILSILTFNKENIDLVFYFEDKENIYIERAQKRDKKKYSLYELETLKLFEKELKNIVMSESNYEIIKIFNKDQEITVDEILNKILSIYNKKR